MKRKYGEISSGCCICKGSFPMEELEVRDFPDGTRFLCSSGSCRQKWRFYKKEEAERMKLFDRGGHKKKKKRTSGRLKKSRRKSKRGKKRSAGARALPLPGVAR